MLEPVDLRYFQTIMNHRSLTVAARVLRVSQPALTGSVRRLEESLGSTLLLRTHAGVQATESGQRLLAHAAEIFAAFDACERDVQGAADDTAGSFVLGCNESLGAYFLAGFLGPFLACEPAVDLTIFNANSSAVRDAVLARQVHLGLVVNPLPHPELEHVPLFRDAVDLFVATPVSADGAVAPREAPTLDAARARLRAEALIFAGPVDQSRQLLDLLVECDCLPRRTLSCGNLSMVKSLTAAGLGVGVLPRRVAQHGPARLVRLHRELPFLPDMIYAVYRRQLLLSRSGAALHRSVLAHGAVLNANASD